jgi:hypothetical protein
MSRKERPVAQQNKKKFLHDINILMAHFEDHDHLWDGGGQISDGAVAPMKSVSYNPLL